ncbi:MAG: protein kinase, partial [Acidobacteria bacterium]|nr:protein kinase [Acidobacteriota bacterium]
RAGIVHRDLKPGNIMLAKSSGGRQGSPQAKLLDFGLAKPAASAVAGTTLSMLPTTPAGKASLTEQGTILGTFQYMAPEQLEGKDADARTDIFAFGAVLYEMLTGRKAFEGKSHASLIGAIMHTLQDPTAMSPDGSRIVFNQTGATTGGDVMQLQLPLGGSTQRRPVGADGVMPLVQTPFTERNGDISPDGRWLAYEANDSGQF